MHTSHRSTPSSAAAISNPTQFPDVRNTLESLHGTDPAVVDRDELAGLVASVANIRSWLDAYEIRCARRTRELAEAGRCEPTASMFARSGHHSSKDATRIADRNTVCDQLDEFEDALSDGRISAGHLDGVANAMRSLDDETRREFAAAAPELLDAAVGQSVDVFSRQCTDLARHLKASRATSDAEELDRQRAQSNVKRWVDKVTGMCNTRLELDPIRDAAIWSAFDAELSRLRNTDGNARTPWKQLEVDAVVAAITAGYNPRRRANHAGPARSSGPARNSDGPGEQPCVIADDSPNSPTDDDAIARAEAEADDVAHALRVPEITILSDIRTLTEGLHEHSICETQDGIPIPVSTLRRLCCDAEIISVVLGADGVPLDMGRSVRTANRSQRRALRAMHRTCAHPECTVPFSQCKAHHIRWWWKHNGRTDLENLIPLCERHHHLVHEGRWVLKMTPDRIATWYRPDGTLHHTGSCIDRHPPGRPVRPPLRI